MKIRILIILFVLLLTGCVAKSTPAAEYKKISQTDAISMVSQNNVIVLDVRTMDEFNQGHIKNAILIPDYDIEKEAPKILADKDQSILVYCKSGRRSKLAVNKLISMGYTNIYDLGGINNWSGEITT